MENWYRGYATEKLKEHFGSVQVMERVNYRYSDDKTKVVVRYTFQQVEFDASRQDITSQYFHPFLDENNQPVLVVEGTITVLEDEYQKTQKSAKEAEAKAKKETETRIAVEGMNPAEKAEFDIQQQVNALVSAPEVIKKTKKDKIIVLVKAGFTTREQIQKYYPTDKSYLEEVFVKNVDGILVPFNK